MTRAAVVAVFLLACGSPAHDAPDGGGEADAGTPDAPATPPDAPAPLLGTTCPSRLTEVARIANAWDSSAYSVHDVLVGKLDNNATSDVLLVEDRYDSANARTLLRFRIFLSDGTTFAAPVTSPDATFPQYGPEQVLLGDFNGDHLADVLIAYTDSEDVSRVSYVYVATQQADHTFVLGPARDVSACKSSSDERYFALGVVDADRDGKDDLLATVSYGGLGAQPEGLSLLKGTASGLGTATCARSSTVSNGNYAPQMVSAERFRTGDFDGDGATDVMALYDHSITLFRNTAAQTFTAAGQSATYTSGIHIATDPVNHGLIGLDVKSNGATATRFAASAAGVTAAPIGTFVTEGAPLGNYDAIRGFTVADFNGDGFTDVFAVGNHDYSDNFPDPVSFGIACDRSARWDMYGGGFPGSIYEAQAIQLAGRTDVIVQSAYDLVVYKLDP